MNVNDQWTQVAEKCQRLAQGLVLETKWMRLLPVPNGHVQLEMRWSAPHGIEVNAHYKKAEPVHQADADEQLLAAQNLPALFALISAAADKQRKRNAEDAATMEMTQLVLADVLAEDGKEDAHGDA